MELLKTKSYDIVNSKSGQPIPVINGVHLHSVYNPSKEAKSILDKHCLSLETNKSTLILGLGFGYHLVEVINIMKDSHDDFKILVIEPNIQVYEDFLATFNHDLSHVTFLVGQNIQELYSNKELVDFLISRPTVISHPASFNLWREYFTTFLSYKASRNLQEVLSFMDDSSLKTYLKFMDDHETIDTILQETNEGTQINNKFDYFLMAFNQLVGKDQAGATNEE